jgi:hypothetical protein
VRGPGPKGEEEFEHSIGKNGTGKPAIIRGAHVRYRTKVSATASS